MPFLVFASLRKLALCAVLSMGMALPATAHEVRPAITDVTVTADMIEIILRAPLEPLIAGMDLAGLEDTNLSPLSDRYDALRAETPDQLEAALRAAAAGGRHDSLEFQSCCGCLVQDLLGANRIAEIAQPTTAADRYAVRLSSFRAQRFGARGHALLADLMRFENMQARAEQAVEQHVPIVQIGFSGMAATTQDQFAIQAQPGAGGCGLARMVRLQGTYGENRVGAQRLRLAKQELQLAQLVAAQAEAGEVVALDVKPRSAEMRRQVRQRLDRRRQQGKCNARKTGQVH